MEKMTIELLLAKNITLNNTHFWKASDVASLAGYDSIKDIMHAIYGGIEECASRKLNPDNHIIKLNKSEQTDYLLSGFMAYLVCQMLNFNEGIDGFGDYKQKIQGLLPRRKTDCYQVGDLVRIIARSPANRPWQTFPNFKDRIANIAEISDNGQYLLKVYCSSLSLNEIIADYFTESQFEHFESQSEL